MSSPKPTGALPAGFVSPFKRVQMEERTDDSLACIATITGRSLADVKTLAVELGYPPYGPAWVDTPLIQKMLFNLGHLKASNYLDFTTIAALPDVAILMVDYDAATDIGRHVVFHHVRGSSTTQSFNYVIDPAGWIDPALFITTQMGHLEGLKAGSAWFIRVEPLPSPTPAGKAK